MQTISDDTLEEESDANERIVLEMIRKWRSLVPDPPRRTEASKAVKERGNDGMISI